MSTPPINNINLSLLSNRTPEMNSIDLSALSGPTSEAVLGFSATGSGYLALSGGGQSELRFSVIGSGSAAFDGSGYSAVMLEASGNGYQDWVSALDPAELQEIYTLTVTGAADNVDDVTIPISSWQATSQASPRKSYVQAVIPAAGQYLDMLTDRKNGDLVIKQGFRFADGTSKTEEIVRAAFERMQYTRGPSRLTATVSGYSVGYQLQKDTRSLEGVRSVSLSNSKYRVRCKSDLFLRPGMTAAIDDASFTVSYINYYVSGKDRFCEVSDE